MFKTCKDIQKPHSCLHRFRNHHRCLRRKRLIEYFSMYDYILHILEKLENVYESLSAINLPDVVAMTFTELDGGLETF